MAGVGAGGEDYSPWCPATWVDTDASTTVGEHVGDHAVGATHNSSWVDSSVPELPSLADWTRWDWSEEEYVEPMPQPGGRWVEV